MLLVADNLRVEALLEKMADAVVSLVEPLRVDPVQAMHAARDVFELGLDDQMKVVVEQAKGVNGPAETRSRVAKRCIQRRRSASSTTIGIRATPRTVRW